MADNFVMPDMTWTEIDEAMKKEQRPVALLPVGATEAAPLSAKGFSPRAKAP